MTTFKLLCHLLTVSSRHLGLGALHCSEATGRVALKVTKKTIFPHLHVDSRIGRQNSRADFFASQADIDLSKRAGELTEEEIDKIVTIMQNPRQYKIPDWFLNRQKDVKDGKTSQVRKRYIFKNAFLEMICRVFKKQIQRPKSGIAA